MAKTKPQTEQVTTIKSWQEVDSTLRAIAVIDSKVMADDAQMNDDMLKVKTRYLPGIQKLQSEKIGLERDIQLFCESQKERFTESRSQDLNYGKVGFRRGTGALKTLKGFTWESVKNLIKASKKFRDIFLRVKEDIDKQAIIGANLKTEELAKLGVQIAQEDSFYYEAYLKRAEELPAEAGGKS